MTIYIFGISLLICILSFIFGKKIAISMLFATSPMAGSIHWCHNLSLSTKWEFLFSLFNNDHLYTTHCNLNQHRISQTDGPWQKQNRMLCVYIFVFNKLVDVSLVYEKWRSVPCQILYISTFFRYCGIIKGHWELQSPPTHSQISYVRSNLSWDGVRWQRKQLQRAAIRDNTSDDDWPVNDYENTYHSPTDWLPTQRTDRLTWQ